ncbi:MFS transporter [Paenibacillus donghaensis]|uniref:MFS transporter n=1 Tax=Paenibacillus donghaensis TaxID=414771 RepID=A0A2Z2KJL8_9BACL|nr:MFS transporter [Paenibacillus donghaensis]ASA22519.1 MFS transporter [Paenibacillus donghaensis]
MSSAGFGRFLCIWAGEWISSIGSGLTAFALGVYVFQLTQTATSVALVTLCAFVPSILLSPLGGVFADRYDRRLMMIAGDLLSVLGLMFILVLMLQGDPSLWQICLGVTASSVFVSLLEPAYKATITDLLSPEQYARASGLVQLAGASKYLLSPVLAGLLLRFMDIKSILLIDISTFLVTVLTVMAVRKQLPAERSAITNQSWIKELIQGWETLVSARGVLLLTVLLSLVTFYIGFIQTLFTPLLLSFTDSQTLGNVISVSACGMLAGSLLIGLFSLTRHYVRWLALGLAAAGIFMTLVGVTPNLYVIAGSGFMFFAALPWINTSADVLIRSHIASSYQGRVWGLIGIISQLGYVAAYGCAGVLADHVFNPLLIEGGRLASTVGQVIGTGEGRGIGLMLVISGVLLVLAACILPALKSVRSLEQH